MAWYRAQQPSGGGEVEESYIYGTYDAGFNSGHLITPNTRVKFKGRICAWTIENSTSCVFGVNGVWAFWSKIYRQQFALQCNGKQALSSYVNAADSSIYPLCYTDCIFDVSQERASWYDIHKPEDVKTISITDATPTSSLSTMGIFCLNNVNTEGNFTMAQCRNSGTLYWFEIYEGDELVKRFVPAYNNNQYCLYDELNDNYIYTLGNSLCVNGRIV